MELTLVASLAGALATLTAGFFSLLRSSVEDRRRERTLLQSAEVGSLELELKALERALDTQSKSGSAKDDGGKAAAALKLARDVASLQRRVDRLESDPAIPADERERAEFRRLWDEAQARLAKYHELAVIQGRQSFRMLLLFSALGFGLLGFVVWRATAVDTTAGGIALGAASAAGGALTAFISRTFMRAYRDANERLIDYFAEPLDMSRLLAAERLLAEVDRPTRSEATIQIISAALGTRLGVRPPAAQGSIRRPIDADGEAGSNPDSTRESGSTGSHPPATREEPNR